MATSDARVDLFQRIFEATPDALLVVDPRGRIQQVNAQAERMFGYERAELVGRPVELLVPQRFAHHHGAQRSAYLREPRTRPMGVGLDLFGRRKDAGEFPVDIMLGPIETQQEGALVLCVVRDVSDRRAAQQRILESLREKEVLLKEIHHRVKNNLALISSLFYLQTTYTKDESMLKILQESQDRVRSMALVHETLYSAESLARVDFAEYAVSLTRQLLGTYALEASSVRLVTELERMEVNVDRAVPLGLILNELVTNALKHGLTRGGELRLTLARNERGERLLCVSDTGPGLPPGLDLEGASSLGLRLLRALCRQLDARFEVRSGPPTVATVTLPPEPGHDER